MTLGFKQKFPWGEPTNFREKILAGAGYVWATMMYPQTNGNPPIVGESYAAKGPQLYNPKIHTMRADPTNRWKAGRKIEMVYRGAGYKIIDHFNKGIPELEVCTGVQKVKISCIVPPPSKKNPLSDPETYWPKIEVDGRVIGYTDDLTDKDEVLKFVQNDGFESITQFVMWFNKPWEGKIIHFTNFRY